MPKILLIEDDLPLARMYQVAFRLSALEFRHAADGDEGLQAARQEKPDLILLDLVLPKKNGFDVLTALKKDTELAAIPVICLSVLHQKEDQDRCRQLGAADYFIKNNIPPEEVVTRVTARLKG